MNKIYKVIWSKVRGCYVVVSEFAKSHTKDKKRKVATFGIVFNSLVLGVFFSVICIGACYPVFAVGVEANGTALGSHTVAVGDSAVAGSYKHIVVVDDCDSETGSPVYWSDGSVATGLTDGIYYIDSDGKLIMNQSDESLRIVHDGAVAVGYNAQALSDNSIAIGGNSQSFGSDSVALGYNSSANSADTVAVGFHAAASEHGGLAVGSEAKSSGEYSTAIGADASALNSSSTSLGANAVAGGYKFVKVVGGKAENGGAVYYSDGTSASSLPDGIYYVNLTGKILLDQNNVSLRVVQDNATAIGSGSSALGADSSAFGYNSYSSGVSSVALGNDAKSTGDNSVALGKDALSKLKNSVAIGYGAVAGPSDSTTNITNISDSIAIGANANAAGNRSVSIGSASSVTGNNSIGIGYQTVVSGDNSYVIGNGASATASYGNAIGYGAQSTGNYSIAIGLQSIASVGDAIAFGHSASSSGTGAIAFGRNSEGTGTSSISLGDAAKATNSYAEALGYKSSASGNSSSAVGSNSSAAGTESGAFGYQSSAGAIGSLALGGFTTASSNYSTAIGYKSTASGEKSIALGYSSKVVGASSGAIGDPNNVYGGSSYVIGNNNTVGQDGSTVLGVGTFVLGNNVSTTANNSVALGNNTTLTEDDVVSVGSETSQRRIVNVADGTSASNAATVGQTIELVAGDGVSIEETGTNAIGQKQYTVSSPLSVQYDSDTKDVISLAGAAGTKITNISDGEVSSTSSDAVTGSQLYAEQQTRITADSVLQTAVSDEATARTEADIALSGRIDTVDSNISAINSDISNLQTKDSEISSSLSDLSDSVVKYSSDDKSSVVLEGTAGTVISNVKNGAVSEISTEAVNGSQLYAEQQARINQDNILAGSVSDEILARQAADNTLTSRIDTVDGSISTINSNISDLQNKNSELESDLNDLEVSSVKYSTSDNTVLTFSGAGGTLLSNLAEGTVSETSTDAVRGSQLYAEQQARISADNALTNSINNEISIRQATDNALSDRIDTVSDNVAFSVKYSDSTKASVVLDGESGTVISNVKNGTISETSTEAVNGSQLYAEQQARINADSAFSSDILSLQNKDSELASDLSSEITARADADTNLSDRISALDLTVSGISGSAVKYDSDTSDVVTLAGSSGTKITNIAAGAVSDVSTDAVTGSQLYAEQQARISSDNNFSGRIDTLDGLLSSETSTRQSEDARIEARIDSINTSIGNIENAVVYDDSNKGVITLSGVDGTKITNLSDGVVSDTSTDAVTGSQLYAEIQNRITQDNALDVRLGNVETSVSSLSTKNTELKTSIDNEIAERESEVSRLDLRIDSINTSIGNVDNAVFYDSSSKDKVTLSGTAGTVIDNVKAGEISDISMQAVNGSQLYAEQQARLSADNTLSDKIDAEIFAREALSGVVSSVETSLGNLTSSVSDLDSSVVKYSDSNKETIVFGGVDGTKISNIADGNISDSSSEAVTGAQLYAEIQSRTAQDNILGTRLDTVETSITALGVKDTELKTSIDDEIAERESEVSRLDLRIDSINSSIGNIENAVLYDNSTKDTISLAGTSGTKITNLSDGVLSDTSTDAVSGKQLYAEQQARVSSDNNLSGRIDTLDGLLSSETSTRQSEDARIEARIDSINASISNIDNVVLYDGSTKNTVSLAGTSGTKITNLSDGVVSDTSTDAVSGKQLYAEQQARLQIGSDLAAEVSARTVADTALSNSLNSEVSERESEVSRLDTRIDSIDTAISNIDNVVSYDSVSKDKITLSGLDGTKITNLADGVLSETSTDAVSGSQLYAEQQARISADSALQNSINTEAADRANADNVLSGKIDTLNGSLSTVNSSISGLQTKDSQIENALNSEVSLRESEDSRIEARIDAINTSISDIDNAVYYSDSSKNEISFEGASGTKLKNVAEGELSNSSMEAVNGSQLYAEQQARIAADSSLQDSLNSEITARTDSDNVLSGRLDTVVSDISVLQAKDTALENSLSDEVSARTSADTVLSGRIDTVVSDLSDLDDSVVKYSSDKSSVALAGVNGTVLDNLKSGEISENSMQAVNGSQLYVEQQDRINSDNTLSSRIDNEVSARTNADVALSDRIDALSSGISGLSEAVLYSNGKTEINLEGTDGTLITNLKEGSLSDSSTDAVRGSQLYAEKTARENSDIVIGNRLDTVESSISNIDSFAVRYDGMAKDKMTLSGVSGTVIGNVATGEITASSMEAINGSQLYAEQQARISSVNTLTNSLADEVSLREAKDAEIAQSVSDEVLARQNAVSSLSDNLSSEVSRLDSADAAIRTSVTNEASLRASADTAINARIDSLAGDVGSISNSSVVYDDDSSASLSFRGASGTVLKNVAQGEVSENSMEAVNGSQLYTERQARIDLGNQLGTRIDNEVSVLSQKDDEIEDALNTEIVNRENAVAGLRNEFTDMVNGVSGSMVSYSSSDKSHIVLAGSGGTVISNLRAGQVSVSSTEAVTGSQLYAEQQAREAAVADIEGRLDSIEAVTGNNVIGYDNTDKDSVTFAGDSGTTLKNVADGSISEGSMEAVNGGQLYDEQQARIEADNALRNEFGNMVAGITDNVIKYDDDSDKGALTFAGDSGTVLKNVAGGDISEGSMEAVNGGQLYETNKKIETLDNRVGVVKDGSFVRENNTVGENINSLDDAVAANSSAIEELGGKVQSGFNVLGRRVNNAGAHAAALAALNPVAEDDSKLGFAAGMGSYHNAKAGAIGLFYRPADRYQISLGGTTGSGEHMYNLGLSVALDKNVGGPFANKKAMIREIVRLRDERDIRDEQMKDLLEENRAQAEVLMVQNEKIAELENSRAEQDAKIDALMKMVQDIQKDKKVE